MFRIRYKTILIIVFTTGYLIPTSGQELYRKSLSAGLQTSIAKVSQYEVHTAAAGLNFDHQWNYLEWFSLRLGLSSTYTFPSSLEIFEKDQRTVLQYQNVHLSLMLAPVLYHRDEKFNLFAGVSGGFGFQFRNSRKYRTPVYEVIGSNYGDPYFNFWSTIFKLGYRPFAGMSFPLGYQDRHEIEFSFSYEEWARFRSPIEHQPFYWFGTNIAYRYNFGRK